MTVTTVPLATTRATSAKALWARGAVAGVVASVATVSIAALAHAAGASLSVGGDAIPLAGFAQFTFACTMIGTAIAAGLGAWARRPRATFVKTTVVLTTFSLVPDALADASTGTRLLLALTHVVAAAIVIPALATRLGD
jgi:hypothetical protein